MTASLPPLPAAFATTRGALHLVAAHVLARRRADAIGRIGLRAAPGGVATPAFGDEVEVVRTSGASLVRERAGRARVVSMTTLADLAAVAGVDLGAPLDIGHDPPPLGDPDAPLAVDPASARALADWFAFVAEALDAVGADDPSAVQIWPEHFDAACDVAWGPADGQRANLGGSPGDGFHAEPYLYVGPWGPERPGDPAYWNAPFGAILPHARLREAADARGEALGFLRRGLDLLASEETR
ncbi:MAG: hypothetical protein QOD86_2928 [Miltoncostaeaceae bacterium]|nr:hypothetical protein [Miltoncostaeaceae bacterium]